ncbi:sulfotransferase [Winogradskyella flava]|uniref:sulfotransferase n=1 Tax=Winogradskyella flava TaxID=1884876 RepID=UPI002492B5CB|nr:sulfotransferase [Winogradskyella flava]
MFNLNLARRLGVAGKYDDKFRYFINLKKRLIINFRSNPKIFVIGLNKTGTSSTYYALKELGIDMSNQHNFESIYDDILDGKDKFPELFKLCTLHEGFQDIPFSIPELYKEFDKKFPKSKFILTIRDNSDEWFNSFKNYYGSEEKMKISNYTRKGYLFKVFSKMFSSNSFDEDTCKDVYTKHETDVKEYFKNRSSDLLVINVKHTDSYRNLCAFLSKEPLREQFEWKNKTK